MSRTEFSPVRTGSTSRNEFSPVRTGSTSRNEFSPVRTGSTSRSDFSPVRSGSTSRSEFSPVRSQTDMSPVSRSPRRQEEKLASVQDRIQQLTTKKGLLNFLQIGCMIYVKIIYIVHLSLFTF